MIARLRSLVPRRAEVAAMLRLAAPVVVVQVGMMTMGVVDTMVVGRVSAVGLAAVALGNLTVMAVCAFGFGLVSVLDPLVAQAAGAGDRAGMAGAVQRGMVLMVGASLPMAAALTLAEPALLLLRQPPEVVPVAVGYVLRCLPGLPPMLAFLVLRHALQALEHLRPVVVTTVVANLVNLVLDVAMVHGRLGFPPLGAYGSAWATTASRALLFALLMVLAWRELGPLLQPFGRDAFRLRPLLAMLRLGLPIAAQVQLEFIAFAVVGLLMGGMGAVAMAAHQVAINLASLTFMVPLGVAAAAAVRVGRAVGRGDSGGMTAAAGAALACGGGFMALMAAAFLLAPRLLAAAYTDELAVVTLAAALIPVAGVFQIFDGIQVVSTGILRGLGDTRPPLVVNLLGFWLLGIPTSLMLGVGRGLGPVGLWWGLVLGLAIVATLLLGRVAVKLAQPVGRVDVGH